MKRADRRVQNAARATYLFPPGRTLLDRARCGAAGGEPFIFSGGRRATVDAPASPPAAGKVARATAQPTARSLTAAGLVSSTYLSFYVLKSQAGIAVPDSIAVGVPFLLIPFLYLRSVGQAPELGALDLTFLLSAAAYAPFALWVAAAAPGAAWFFAPYAATVSSFPFVLWWSVDTFFHVGAVDYFTKRVVQHEAEARWGAWNGLWCQVAAWGAGHLIEWLWLRLLLGDLPAAAFLVLAGFVTGLAYMRWKNVLGLMVGHFLVNVAAAAAAVVLYL